jgi:nitrite reductase (NADH) large subunit
MSVSVDVRLRRGDQDAPPEQAEVRFAAGPTALARPGESLLKVAEAHQVPLRSGCRMGLCGADPVRIIAGDENLSPPSAAEQATLRRLGLPPECRMACSARVRGPVTVAPVENARVPEIAPGWTRRAGRAVSGVGASVASPAIGLL